ncbi:MAG: hypothetical protein OIF35_12335 [Cellvibrionaceae bacterium]|nr:hypothetical protein [Cellvibrionaceae bacterium]
MAAASQVANKAGAKKYWFWLLPLLLVLATLAVFAFRFAMADMVSYNARYSSERWFKQDRLPSAEELDQALAEIQRARSWNPYHADYHDLQAYLLWLAILREQRQAQAGSQARIAGMAASAVALHQQAIALRPRWPYSWSGIALMKAYQQDFGASFAQAVQQAVRYGPWENTVNVQLALATQLAWPQLQAPSQQPLKQALLENLNRGMRRNSKAIGRYLKQSPHRHHICAHLSRQHKQYQQICN